MAVLRTSNTVGESTIRITNGDFQALQRIATEYGLRDESDVIAFAIGVLNQAGGRGVTVERSDGSPVKLLPAENLRRSR